MLPVGDETLQFADGNRFSLYAEYAFAFALGLLRTDSAADCGERRVAGNHFRSCREIAGKYLRDEIGNLQIAVAAYNEYNDEAAMDVEVDWICHYDSCTKEQLDAIDGYIYWYNNAQNGNGDSEGTIKYYQNNQSTYYNPL